MGKFITLLQIVLLGKFNAQGLGTDHELLLRMTKGKPIPYDSIVPLVEYSRTNRSLAFLQCSLQL